MSRNLNPTITQAAFTQGAAGSLDLVAAPTTGRIYVVKLVVALTATGTLKFQEGASTDLTGAMTLATGIPLVLSGDGITAILQTLTAATKLNLVSATGAATGYIRYYLDV